MKKKLLVFWALLIVSFCQEQDFEVLDVFSFDVSASLLEDQAFVHKKATISLKIIPEKMITTASYYVEYSFDRGTGKIYIDGKERIQEEKTEIDTQAVEIEFIAENTDPVAITFRVEHANDSSLFKTVSINIDPTYQKFEVNLFSNSDQFPLNEYSPISLRVNSESEDNNREYHLNYEVASGQGSLYIGSNATYQALPLDEEHLFKEGLHHLFYKPDKVGTGKHIIRLRMTAVDGNVVEQEVTFIVTNLNWSFEAALETTSPKKKTNPMNSSLI